MNLNPPLRLQRKLVAVCMALTTLALVACGGGSGDNPITIPAEPGTLAASRPGEVTGYVQQRLRTLNAQGRLGTAGLAGDTMGSVPPSAMGATGATSASPPPRSGTLLQEEGVDEADLIQTDGTYLYTVQPQAAAGPLVSVYQRDSAGKAQALRTVALAANGTTGVNTDGMVLSADQRALAVISQHWTSVPAVDVCETCLSIAPGWMRNSVDVQRVDVSTPGAASAGERVNIDGYLVDTRRVGNALVVVTTHRPALSVETLPATATTADREAAIARLTAAEVLPRMRRNGGASEPLVAETDCYLQTANGSLAVEFTTITVFDLGSPSLPHASRCFVGGAEALYMSTNHIYLATTRWTYPSDTAMVVFPPSVQTDIHKFALASVGAVSYRASGQVEGHLGWDRQRMSLRLSEHNGDLRVLSYTGQVGWITAQDSTVAPSPARLTVLRESTGTSSSDRKLQAVSTLPNATRPALIGKAGEQVYAVRFVGDRGYVVTFQRTDPLYVLDLSNPADPKTVGELEVAGFSDHLFPLAKGLLLGVGRDADSSGRIIGLKVALFDVANPTAPTQRASLTLGSTGSLSALDHSRHGLNLLALGNLTRVALPVNLTSAPYTGWQHGLQRLEVDTDQGTLRDLGLLDASANTGSAPLWLERSLQIGDQVHVLSGGALKSHTW